jgi:hypothetical protein
MTGTLDSAGETETGSAGAQPDRGIAGGDFDAKSEAEAGRFDQASAAFPFAETVAHASENSSEMSQLQNVWTSVAMRSRDRCSTIHPPGFGAFFTSRQVFPHWPGALVLQEGFSPFLDPLRCRLLCLRRYSINGSARRASCNPVMAMTPNIR